VLVSWLTCGNVKLTFLYCVVPVRIMIKREMVFFYCLFVFYLFIWVFVGEGASEEEKTFL
jgi:hypothetical protein